MLCNLCFYLFISRKMLLLSLRKNFQIQFHYLASMYHLVFSSIIQLRFYISKENCDIFFIGLIDKNV